MKQILQFLGKCPQKWALLLFLVSFLSLPVYSQQSSRRLISKGTNGAPFGFFEYLPAGYSTTSTTKKPLILYLHGAGEIGNGTSTLYKMKQRALPKLLQNGKEIDFVVIAPQASSRWTNHNLLPMLDWIKKQYNIDPARVYLTGISMGGTKAWDFAGDYPQHITAVLPLGADARNMNPCRLSSLPIWAFHGQKDHIYPYTAMVSAVNKLNTTCNPRANPPAKGTVYSNHGHDDLWDHVFKGTYGDNIYTWMLKYRKSTSTGGTTTGNKAPIANAGPDRSISTTSVDIKGSGSDSDGYIKSYWWTKISGPAGKLSKITSSTMHAYDLVAGTYEFELKVTDDKGATATDRMRLVVGSGSTTDGGSTDDGGTTTSNKAPVANAGPDRAITLPTRATYINGSGTDADGTIKSYWWTKISGPSLKMSRITSASMYAYELVAGTYEFELKVTDNDGAVDRDRMRLTVYRSSSATTTVAMQAVADTAESYVPDSELILMSNPVQNRMIQISSADPEALDEGIVWMYDATGKRFEGRISKDNSLNRWVVPTDQLLPGMYVLMLQQKNGQLQRLRFIQP